MNDFLKRFQYSDLVLLIVFALLLRLFFFVGVGNNEGLQIAKTGWSVADALKQAIGPAIKSVDIPALFSGLKDLYNVLGVRTLFLYAPLGLLYLFDGINDITSIFWPLLCSLLTLVIIYVLANFLIDAKTAILASLLWSVFPLDIYLSTTLLPTVPLVFLFSTSVLLFLFWERRRANWALYCVLVIAIILLLADPFFGLLLVILCLARYLWKRLHQPISIPLILGTIFFLGPVIGFLQLRSPDILFSFLLQQPEAVLFMPLVFIVLPFSVWKLSNENGMLLVCFGTSTAGFLLRFAQFSGPTMFEDPFLLLSIFSLTILVAQYLSPLLPRLAFRDMAIIVVLVLAITWLAVVGQERLIVSFKAYGWVSLASMMYALRILGGAVFIGFIISPIFINSQKQPSRNFFGLVLVGSLILALIPSMWARVEPERSRNQAVRQAFQVLEAAPEYPIYILNDRRVLNQFEYLSNYSGKYSVSSESIHVIGAEEIDIVDDGYLVYWDDYLDSAPATWWKTGVFGDLGQPRLMLARTLAPDEAEKQMGQAITELAKAETSENYLALYAAALNNDELCLAYDSWIKARELQADDWAYIPVGLEVFKECFTVNENENLIGSPPFPIHGGYTQPLLMTEPDDPNWELRVSKKYKFFDDPRTFDIGLTLDTGAIYLYSVTVQNREPVMLLYWGSQDAEGYLSVGRFPEWTEKAILLSSPSRGLSLEISLSPVLFDNYGDVYIRDVQFIPVFIPTK